MDNCFRDAYDQICQSQRIAKDTHAMAIMLIVIAVLLYFLVVLLFFLWRDFNKNNSHWQKRKKKRMDDSICSLHGCENSVFEASIASYSIVYWNPVLNRNELLGVYCSLAHLKASAHLKAADTLSQKDDG